MVISLAVETEFLNMPCYLEELHVSER